MSFSAEISNLLCILIVFPIPPLATQPPVDAVPTDTKSTKDLYPLDNTSLTDYYLSAAQRLETKNRLKEKYPQHLWILPESPFNLYLHTMIRSHDCPRSEFIFYSENLFRLLLEYSLEFCEYEPRSILTPTNNEFSGLTLAKKPIAITIMRAGESLENAAMDILGDIQIGKILVQRTDDHNAQLFYSKLPQNISDSPILLLDPMLASGGSASLALQKLVDLGAKEENIVFVTLISVPEGIEFLLKAFPNLRIVTSMIDRELNQNKYILPGIGDFGDLYFGTNQPK